jgi:hypothetical protein
MSTKTPNLQLAKPAQDDFYDIDEFYNPNMDILDTRIQGTIDLINNIQNTYIKTKHTGNVTITNGVGSATIAINDNGFSYYSGSVVNENNLVFRVANSQITLGKQLVINGVNVETALNDRYTKMQSDGRYALKADAYTKAQSDARYRTISDSYAKTEVYTKTEGDNRYLQKSQGYTKTEVDNKINTEKNNVTNAYVVADTVLRNTLANDYKAADTTLSANVTNAYRAADTAVLNTVNNQVAFATNGNVRKALGAESLLTWAIGLENGEHSFYANTTTTGVPISGQTYIGKVIRYNNLVRIKCTMWTNVNLGGTNYTNVYSIANSTWYGWKVDSNTLQNPNGTTTLNWTSGNLNSLLINLPGGFYTCTITSGVSNIPTNANNLRGWIHKVPNNSYQHGIITFFLQMYPTSMEVLSVNGSGIMQGWQGTFTLPVGGSITPSMWKFYEQQSGFRNHGTRSGDYGINIAAENNTSNTDQITAKTMQEAFTLQGNGAFSKYFYQRYETVVHADTNPVVGDSTTRGLLHRYGGVTTANPYGIYWGIGVDYSNRLKYTHLPPGTYTGVPARWTSVATYDEVKAVQQTKITGDNGGALRDITNFEQYLRTAPTGMGSLYVTAADSTSPILPNGNAVGAYRVLYHKQGTSNTTNLWGTGYAIATAGLNMWFITFSGASGQIYALNNGANWRLITTQQIYNGTGNPSNSSGKDGDIYIKYI